MKAKGNRLESSKLAKRGRRGEVLERRREIKGQEKNSQKIKRLFAKGKKINGWGSPKSYPLVNCRRTCLAGPKKLGGDQRGLKSN